MPLTFISFNRVMWSLFCGVVLFTLLSDDAAAQVAVDFGGDNFFDRIVDYIEGASANFSANMAIALAGTFGLLAIIGFAWNVIDQSILNDADSLSIMGKIIGRQIIVIGFGLAFILPSSILFLPNLIDIIINGAKSLGGLATGSTVEFRPSFPIEWAVNATKMVFTFNAEADVRWYDQIFFSFLTVCSIAVMWFAAIILAGTMFSIIIELNIAIAVNVVKVVFLPLDVTKEFFAGLLGNLLTLLLTLLALYVYTDIIVFIWDIGLEFLEDSVSRIDNAYFDLISVPFVLFLTGQMAARLPAIVQAAASGALSGGGSGGVLAATSALAMGGVLGGMLGGIKSAINKLAGNGGGGDSGGDSGSIEDFQEQFGGEDRVGDSSMSGPGDTGASSNQSSIPSSLDKSNLRADNSSTGSSSAPGNIKSDNAESEPGKASSASGQAEPGSQVSGGKVSGDSAISKGAQAGAMLALAAEQAAEGNIGAAASYAAMAKHALDDAQAEANEQGEDIDLSEGALITSDSNTDESDQGASNSDEGSSDIRSEASVPNDPDSPNNNRVHTTDQSLTDNDASVDHAIPRTNVDSAITRSNTSDYSDTDYPEISGRRKRPDPLNSLEAEAKLRKKFKYDD